MTQAVTELIVRGDGALVTLDRYEAGMERAGAATEQTTGAVAEFERRMETARAAIERGNAVTTESISRKTAEQRAWEKWAGTVDRTQALRIRLDREAAQAAVAAANAVNLGYATQEQALTTLIALEQRHAAQLQAATDGQQRATQATVARTAANDNLNRSLTQTASRSGGTFDTANIAAQFQDIGVTAAMGMSPMMIALQQGTQLSAVLNTMQSPLRGLASAFLAIINPVSLLTIGFVALGAAAIQWFMSASSGAEEASSALEAHDAWLNEILAGYGAMQEAARAAGEEAQRMPQAELDITLDDKATQQQDAYAAALARVQEQLLATNTNQQTLTSLYLEGGDAALQQRDALLGIQAAAMQANPDLNALGASLLSFIVNNPESVLLNIAQAMYDNVRAARDAKSALDQTVAASFAGKTAQDQLAAAARGSASGIMASVAASWQAVQSYGVAAGAALNYASAMRELGALIPEVAAAQAQMENLNVAQSSYNEALASNRTLLREQAITQAEFTDRQAEAADLYQRARDQITGLTDATKSLAQAEREAAVGAMAPREAAIQRIRDKYAELDTALRNSGASQDELTRSAAAMNQEIATSNASFDETARSAGGAAGAVGGAADAYGRMVETARQQIEQTMLQAETMNIATQSASALRFEQEMLNQAANDNLALSPIQREEIALLAEQWSQAEASLAGVRFAMGDPTPWDEAVQNIQNVDAALASGALSWEQYGAAAFKANAGAASAVLGLAGGFTGALSQMFQDNKAFAVANAVVSTAEAVMKALSIYGPTPWGFAAAGVAAATGAAQIVSILSAQKGSSSVSKPGAGTLPGAAERPAAEAARATQINVTLGGSGRYSRDEVRDLLEQLTDGMSDNVDGGQFKLAVKS